MIYIHTVQQQKVMYVWDCTRKRPMYLHVQNLISCYRFCLFKGTVTPDFVWPLLACMDRSGREKEPSKSTGEEIRCCWHWRVWSTCDKVRCCWHLWVWSAGEEVQITIDFLVSAGSWCRDPIVLLRLHHVSMIPVSFPWDRKNHKNPKNVDSYFL